MQKNDFGYNQDAFAVLFLPPKLGDINPEVVTEAIEEAHGKVEIGTAEAERGNEGRIFPESKQEVVVGHHHEVDEHGGVDVPGPGDEALVGDVYSEIHFKKLN